MACFFALNDGLSHALQLRVEQFAAVLPFFLREGIAVSVQTTKRETYRFEASDLEGRLRQGHIEASSREQAIEKLDKYELSYIKLALSPYKVTGEDETEEPVIEESNDPTQNKPYAKIRTLSETLKEYQSPYSYLSYVYNICLVFAWFLIVVSVIFVLIGIGVAIVHAESNQYASGSGSGEPESSNAMFYFAVAAGILFWSFLLHIAAAFFRGFASLCASTDLSADLLITLRKFEATKAIKKIEAGK